jgi:hypothetical protein
LRETRVKVRGKIDKGLPPPRRTGVLRRGRLSFVGSPLVVAALLGAGWATPAAAQRIENGVAVFAALDKVTARISKLEAKLNESVRFGALKVTPRACYSRPPTEPPKTTAFVEVDEMQLDGKEKRIFTGWMFADSPGLNAVEHPVFDVWLTECTQPLRAIAGPQKGAPSAKGQPAAEAAPPDDDVTYRRRPRR